jgi:hypothetical protein
VVDPSSYHHFFETFRALLLHAIMCSSSVTTDWFKGGKGPDPKLAALDREMDEYNAAKGAASSAPASANASV